MEERFKTRKRKRVNKSSKDTATITDLPCSILGDIFSRLPIKSILSCHGVSQSWRNFISDPERSSHIPLLKSLPESYILRSNQHVNRIHPRKLVCLFDQEAALSSTTTTTTNTSCKSGRDCKDATIVFKPDFGLPITGDFELVNSCNGFLCLRDSQSRYPTFVLNPITGEYIKLPRYAPPKDEVIENCSIFSRLGFSPSTSQYKVVRCFFNHPRNKSSRIEIHTLGTETWRRIYDCPSNLLFSDQTHSDAFLNGSLHWVGPDCNFISSFNFDNEKYWHISPPSGYSAVTKENKFYTSLGVIGGCLSAYFLVNNSESETWVMKEYNVNNSWTRELVLRPRPATLFRSLRLLNNAEFVLYDGRNLVSHRPRNVDPGGDQYLHNTNIKTHELCGIENFQLVYHAPSFTSFRDIALGENLKVFRVDMIRERRKMHKIIGQSEDELKSRACISWCPPSVNELKFNVDGYVPRGKAGAAGIGGVLKDDEGNVLCLFSSPIRTKKSHNVAEIMAIMKALQLFKVSEWNGVKELVIESHSKLALALINNGHQPALSNVCSVLKEIKKRVRFVHSFKEGNYFADRLARMGVDKAAEFCQWF